MVIFSSDKTMLKQHGVTVIYAPMLRHIHFAESTYEPVRQYIIPAKWR